MFKVNNLTAYIENKKILDEFSLDINNGEIHAIMGKNGIGKSTLCQIILNDPHYEVKRGSIIYNGKLYTNTITIYEPKYGNNSETNIKVNKNS